VVMHKKDYNKDHCYQFDIRLKSFDNDLKEANLSVEEVENLKVTDFDFKYVPKDDELTCKRIKEFIIKHEWLGKMPHRPTHRFIATHKGILAGVIVMATPNAFSNLLGKENRDKEKLISRGACISWSPKNLGSSLIMFSIRWMVKNTSYRYFTAYSDTEARELGTIYQACNFIYLGQNSGARYEYFDSNCPAKGWFSDRNFRKTTSYKKYAIELGIEWQKSWSYRDKIFWDKVPDKIKAQLKERSKLHLSNCKRRAVPRKHKYVYILGKNKKETKRLLKIFKELNPSKQNLKYPKSRGPQQRGHSSHGIIRQELTRRPFPCWPLDEGLTPKKKFYSIKEVVEMYGISQWLIYHHIKTDPTFPYVNIGVKKRFLIDLEKLDQWLANRNKEHIAQLHQLPSSSELLEVI